MSKKLYVDFDNTIVNSVAAITSLYNEDFKYYENFHPVKWWEVNTWDFEECNCAKTEYLKEYFNQERFFKRLTYQNYAKEILTDLHSNGCDISIVSLGTAPNLKHKQEWIEQQLPFCKFIPINSSKYDDKSCIDMRKGVLIDDSNNMLAMSNAMINICYGEERSWNEDWDGFRCATWLEVSNFLKKGVFK